MTIKIFILLYTFSCVINDLNSHSLLNVIFKSVYMFLYEIDKHNSLMTHLQTKFPVALHERGGWGWGGGLGNVLLLYNVALPSH